ncbi:MAG: carboxypeptidase regulatory-like domain-containing protein [Terriglobia bacterium]
MSNRVTGITRSSGILLATLAMALLIAAVPVRAQTGNASITGSVMDPTGALVPGASIAVVNTQTGQKAETTTVDNGTYVMPQLPVGVYSLTVSHPGFKSQTQSGIVLTADQVATVNITLTVGSETQSVQVTANAEMLQTSTAALGQAVNQNSIVELPLNGRNPADLVYLSPGMLNGTLTGSGAFYIQWRVASPNDVAVSANGGREGSVYYMLDGATNMDPENRDAYPFPNADATQEFRVIGNNFEARYGFSPGGVVSIVTKSGTNQWHGDGFEFLRNYNLDAANFFSHQTDTLKRNQFGGSLGGPIKKDKFFIFGNYQRTPENTGVSSSTSFVPNNAELGGDWSGLLTGVTANLCGAGGPSNLNFDTGQLFQPIVGTPVVCPAGSALAGKAVKVRQPYANNQVDPSTYNPVSVRLEQSIPKTSAANSLVTLPGYTTGDKTDEFSIRGDYNINEKQRVSGHVFYQRYWLDPVSAGGEMLAENGNWLDPYSNYQGNWTWTVSPTLVNNLSGSIATLNSSTLSNLIGEDGKPASLALYGSQVSDPPGWPPSIQGFGVSGYFSLPGGGGWSLHENRQAYAIADSLSWTKGKHLMVAGVDVLRFKWTNVTNWQTMPLLSFDGETTGNAAADFLTGSIDSFSQGGGQSNQTHNTDWALFLQDTIRLKPNFTLSAGVRWEPFFPQSIFNGRIGVFRPGQQSTKYPNAPLGLVYPGDAGITDTGGVPSSVDRFSPRLGVAWQPKFLPNTSVRAAFGIFVAPFDNTYYQHVGDNAPFAPVISMNYTQNGVINLTTPWASSPGTGFASPFPPFASLSYVPPPSATFDLPVTVPASFGPGFNNGRTQSWNFSIQHQFSNDILLTVAYVGNESYDLPVQIDRNPGSYAAAGARTTYPLYNSVLEYDSYGTGNYNGLQLSFEKRFSHGLQLTSNYTWSATHDWASTGSTAYYGALGDPFNYKWNYGNADMNFPHIWVTHFVWQTPGLRNHSQFIRQVFGSWQPTGIVTLESGRPFSIAGGCNGSNNSLSLQGGDRADRTGQPLNVRQGSESQWLQEYFNPAAFECNAPGTFGTSARNLMQGPPLNNWDLGIDKQFPFKERYKFEFRWEMFDAWNTPHFSIPVNNPVSPGFGSIFGLVSASPSGETSSPRIMQLGFKFYW